MTNPNVTHESIGALLEHMRTLSAAVTQIQTGQGSMDQTQMDTLILSIKGTAPVPNEQPFCAHNSGQVDTNSIIDYGSSVGSKRYRYATATLSLTEFDHTIDNVLEITMSLTKMSDNSGWGSGTGSITDIKVGAKTYDLFREYEQFTVEDLTAHIKVYVDVDNKRVEQNS